MKAILKEKEITENDFEELLNGSHEPFIIGVLEFEAGRILRKLDPKTFRLAMLEEADSLPDTWICSKCKEEYDTEEKAQGCCI